MEKQIAIIGGGISGLLACKYALSKGFNPIVFEAKSTVGGAWANTVETTKLQTPKLAFRFSDYPWPDSVKDMFPSANQTLDYIESYASHFDLLKYIKFNTEVAGINYEGPSDEEMRCWSHWSGTGQPFSSKGKWEVEVKHSQTHSTQVYRVDFVILCVGRFSSEPNIPEFPIGRGPESFNGKVMHALDYMNMDNQAARNLVKGKKVTVVGFQKSAMDIAMECTAANGTENPCTILYKSVHWNMPKYVPWGVSLGHLYFNRFAELLIHKPGENFLYSLLAKILSPVRWGISKFVESYVKYKLPLAKYGLVPKHRVLQDISILLTAIVPEKFYEKVEDGSIILKKAPNFSFCSKGIDVQGDNTQPPIETDLVIFATGFKGDVKLQNMFVSKYFRQCLIPSPDSAVSLYRECIHPRIPQLAVIGYSEGTSVLFISEMRSQWVAELLDGKIELPSIEDMEKDIGKWNECKQRYSGPYYQKASIAPFQIWYTDKLCRDMGWNPKRKKGFFAELFQPYGPMDYVSP